MEERQEEMVKKLREEIKNAKKLHSNKDGYISFNHNLILLRRMTSGSAIATRQIARSAAIGDDGDAVRGANMQDELLDRRVVAVMAVHADAGASPVVVVGAVEVQQPRVPQDVIAFLCIALVAPHFARDHARAFCERPSKIEGVVLLLRLRSAGLFDVLLPGWYN